MKLSELYHKTGLISSGHTVVATRADLVGQYIGHTGPKTKEMILKSFGGILFIDEAYGLYKEESRDYGSEVLSMLIKFIDNTPRTDFVVVMAGYHDRMENMMSKNIRLFNRIGNWIDFPDYNEEELLQIAEVFVKKSNFRFGPKARGTFAEFMKLRKEFPYFSNARTVRNAIEKARTIAASRAITDMVERDVIYSEQDVFTLRSSDFQKMIDTIKDMPRDSQLP